MGVCSTLVEVFFDYSLMRSLGGFSILDFSEMDMDCSTTGCNCPHIVLAPYFFGSKGLSV